MLDKALSYESLFDFLFPCNLLWFEINRNRAETMQEDFN